MSVALVLGAFAIGVQKHHHDVWLAMLIDFMYLMSILDDFEWVPDGPVQGELEDGHTSVPGGDRIFLMGGINHLWYGLHACTNRWSGLNHGYWKCFRSYVSRCTGG